MVYTSVFYNIFLLICVSSLVIFALLCIYSYDEYSLSIEVVTLINNSVFEIKKWLDVGVDLSHVTAR